MRPYSDALVNGWIVFSANENIVNENHANVIVKVQDTEIGVLFVITVPLPCVHFVEFVILTRTLPLGLIRVQVGE